MRKRCEGAYNDSSRLSLIGPWKVTHPSNPSREECARSASDSRPPHRPADELSRDLLAQARHPSRHPLPLRRREKAGGVQDQQGIVSRRTQPRVQRRLDSDKENRAGIPPSNSPQIRAERPELV